MQPFNFEYICAETVRNILVSFNLINLFGALLLAMFVITAIFRKIHWILIILVGAILLAGMYFATLNIQYTKGCQSSLIYKTELIPAWWRE